MGFLSLDSLDQFRAPRPTGLGSYEQDEAEGGATARGLGFRVLKGNPLPQSTEGPNLEPFTPCQTRSDPSHGQGLKNMVDLAL